LIIVYNRGDGFETHYNELYSHYIVSCNQYNELNYIVILSHTLQEHLTSPTAVILWETLPAKLHREKLPKDSKLCYVCKETSVANT
jgi:hypothetical protein